MKLYYRVGRLYLKTDRLVWHSDVFTTRRKAESEAYKFARMARSLALPVVESWPRELGPRPTKKRDWTRQGFESWVVVP